MVMPGHFGLSLDQHSLKPIALKQRLPLQLVPKRGRDFKEVKNYNGPQRLKHTPTSAFGSWRYTVSNRALITVSDKIAATDGCYYLLLI